MDSIVYKPIRLIAEEFEKADIKYQVLFNKEKKVEILKKTIAIDSGPIADVCFICSNYSDQNDVIIRIAGLITAVDKEKRVRLLETFNSIHLRTPYFTFSLSSEGDINVGYGFPTLISDDCLGKTALLMLIRCNQILNQEYRIIAQALYSNDPIGSIEKNSQE